MSFKYPRNIRFRCMKCAICCGDTEYRVRTVLLLKIEAQRISKKTLKDISEFAEKIEEFEPYVYRMKKIEDEKCIFLKDNLCSIYKMRPLVCIFYPFELKEAENGSYAFAYTDECPAIGKGSQLKRSYFERLFEKFMKRMKEDKKRK